MKIFGKKPRKARKHHSAAYYVIGTITFAVEVMLGINAAFLIDQSVSIVARNMLDGTPIASLATGIALILSIILSVGFAAWGFWTFGGFMDTLKDVQAYQEEYGTRSWPVVLVWASAVLIILIDCATLFFRAAYFAERGEGALLVFFAAIIIIPFPLGCLMYVIEHTPRKRQLAKMRQFASSVEISALDTVIQEMDDDLRSRWLADDATALQEHYDRIAAAQEEDRLYSQGLIEERQRGKEEEQRPLLTASLANEADQRSQ